MHLVAVVADRVDPAARVANNLSGGVLDVKDVESTC